MHIGIIGAGLPESQWVQSKLGRPVVKAFNTIRPAGPDGRDPGADR
jgi:predicted dinucleotide-binding enzyme